MRGRSPCPSSSLWTSRLFLRISGRRERSPTGTGEEEERDRRVMTTGMATVMITKVYGVRYMINGTSSRSNECAMADRIIRSAHQYVHEVVYLPWHIKEYVSCFHIKEVCVTLSHQGSVCHAVTSRKCVSCCHIKEVCVMLSHQGSVCHAVTSKVPSSPPRAMPFSKVNRISREKR